MADSAIITADVSDGATINGSSSSSAIITSTVTEGVTVVGQVTVGAPGPKGDPGDTGPIGPEGPQGEVGYDTIVNEFHFAQKNLTGSSLTALTGATNGTNPTFTLPGKYTAGTLEVYLNGIFQPLGDAIVETTPASGIFTFVTPPATGDQLYVRYQDKVITEDGGIYVGPAGPAGPGVPTGGATNQVLAKTSATDYATAWVNPSAGTGDVVGPASSVNNDVPIFSGTTGKLLKAGYLKASSSAFNTDIYTSGGSLNLYAATGEDITIAPGTGGVVQTYGDTYLGTGAAKTTISGTLELGDPADTTLSRASAGRLAVEGVNVPTVSSTDTLTNKTLTSPAITTPTGIVKSDVGLGNVDNTSDANKPVSTAQATAIGLKQDSDATLTALAGLSAAAGAVYQTGTDTFAKRTMTGTTNRITVTNGNGVAAAPSFDIGTDVVTLSDAQALTNKNLNSGTNTFPTFNQNTTGSAATLTTARTIGTLTGDVTATGSTFNGSAANSNATVLATVNSNVGSFGSASSVGTFTVNAKGLTTAASNTSIQIAESQVTNLVSDLAGKAAASHTHVATTDLTATGTKDSTTFLRGDNTWAVPAGGGGGGGMARSISTITSAVTLGATAATDYVAFIGASGVPTMPTAVGNTNQYTVKNIDTTNKTLATTSSQTIDGSTTITLIPNQSVDLVSNGTNWQVI